MDDIYESINDIVINITEAYEAGEITEDEMDALIESVNEKIDVYEEKSGAIVMTGGARGGRANSAWNTIKKLITEWANKKYVDGDRDADKILKSKEFENANNTFNDYSGYKGTNSAGKTYNDAGLFTPAGLSTYATNYSMNFEQVAKEVTVLVKDICEDPNTSPSKKREVVKSALEKTFKENEKQMLRITKKLNHKNFMAMTPKHAKNNNIKGDFSINKKVLSVDKRYKKDYNELDRKYSRNDDKPKKLPMKNMGDLAKYYDYEVEKEPTKKKMLPKSLSDAKDSIKYNSEKLDIDMERLGGRVAVAKRSKDIERIDSNSKSDANGMIENKINKRKLNKKMGIDD